MGHHVGTAGDGLREARKGAAGIPPEPSKSTHTTSRRAQIRRAVGALGRAEEEVAVRFQGIMKGAASLLLQLAVEVDEQIAAGDEIKMGEGRIF
jgi:hypothetical protein